MIVTDIFMAIKPVMLFFLLPGMSIVGLFSSTPQALPEMLIAYSINVVIWLRLGLFLFCSVGRPVGIYNPEIYFAWQQLCTLPWRPFYRIWLRYVLWREERVKYGTEASARTASVIHTMASVYRPGKIFLGRFRPFGLPAYQPVGLDDKDGRHLMMVAGTGGGKTTLVQTIVALHNSTALIIDPKAQMANTLLRRKGKGGGGVVGQGMKAGVLDPSGLVKGWESWSWNPFDEIFMAQKRAVLSGRNPDDATVEFTQKMIEALVVMHGKSDPFWPGASKDLMLSVALWMVANLTREECTMAKFYELLTIGLKDQVSNPAKESGFDVLLWRLSRDRSYGGIIAYGAAGVIEAGDNVRGSVLITIREQLQWMKRPALRKISERSDFTLQELHPANGKLVLFVCSKLSDIRETFPGWFRLLCALTIAVFEDINKPTKKPCLLVADEFGNLQKISAIEIAAPYIRSFGLRLLCIIQNIQQLTDCGYKNPETFIGNAKCCWWMATNHADNLAYLVKRLGKATIKEQVDGVSSSWFSKSAKGQQHSRSVLREREVLTEDQAGRLMARGVTIVTHDGRAFVLKVDPYFKALPVYYYDTDPNHRETLLRSLTRGFLLRQEQKKARQSLRGQSKPTDPLRKTAFEA